VRLGVTVALAQRSARPVQGEYAIAVGAAHYAMPYGLSHEAYHRANRHE
jgi:hypothetical protein